MEGATEVVAADQHIGKRGSGFQDLGKDPCDGGPGSISV